MVRLGLACLLACVLGVGIAAAAAYDDFANGLSAINRGDNDLAIQAFTSAIAAGDLSPSLLPVAYYQRARAHWSKEGCARAIADLSSAIKLKADYVDAILARGEAESCIGDYPAAIEDLTRANSLNPDVGISWVRGRLRWDVADYPGAVADFAENLKKNPRSERKSYFALWLVLSRLRAGTLDEKTWSGDTEDIDLDSWPGPVFDLYRGKLKVDDVMRLAEKGDASALAGQRCEAKFYAAEWWLAQGNADAARPLLEDALANCPKNFMEFVAAKVELRRLAPPKEGGQ